MTNPKRYDWAKIWRNGCESLRYNGMRTANWRKLMEQRDALRADLLNSREQLLTAQRERDKFKAALESSQKLIHSVCCEEHACVAGCEDINKALGLGEKE